MKEEVVGTIIFFTIIVGFFGIIANECDKAASVNVKENCIKTRFGSLCEIEINSVKHCAYRTGGRGVDIDNSYCEIYIRDKKPIDIDIDVRFSQIVKYWSE